MGLLGGLQGLFTQQYTSPVSGFGKPSCVLAGVVRRWAEEACYIHTGSGV